LILINQIGYNTADHQMFHGYPFENMLNTVTMEDTFENLIQWWNIVNNIYNMDTDTLNI